MERYLSFGPVFPPGNVILQVFHLEIVWKLQQLLFLGTRKQRVESKNVGPCSALGALGRAGEGVAGQVRRRGRTKMKTPESPRESGEVLEQGRGVPGREVGAGGRELGPWGWAHLAVHNGLLLLQLHLLLPCLSTQESLQDRPFGEASLLLQGCLTVWGQGYDGSQVGKLSLEDSSNCPRGGTMLAEEGKRLFHCPPAADAEIQLHTARRMLGKTQPDPQILQDTLRRGHSGPSHAPRHMERPQPAPDTHPDTHGDTDTQDTHGHTQTFTQDTHGYTQERQTDLLQQSDKGRDTPRHSDAPRHMEETQADPWMHPETLKSRFLDHQTLLYARTRTGETQTVPLRQADPPGKTRPGRQLDPHRLSDGRGRETASDSRSTGHI